VCNKGQPPATFGCAADAYDVINPKAFPRSVAGLNLSPSCGTGQIFRVVANA